MADGITVKIEGLADLEFALGELPKATARNVLLRVLKARGAPIAQRWSGAVPHGSGHLARSINVGTKLTPKESRAVRREGKDFAEVYVGTADPAGGQTEFGNFKQAAQPSGRPTYDAMKEGTVDGIAGDLWREIDKARARLARKAERLAAKKG